MEAQTKVPTADAASSNTSKQQPEVKAETKTKVEMTDDTSQDISLEDFSNFLMRKIGEKYRNGMEGLLEKFMTVFNQLARINSIALAMHGKAIETTSEKKNVTGGETNRIEGANFLDGIITLLYSMLKEWEEA